MTEAARRTLNHQVRKLAHGKLGLGEETYRDIVRSVDLKSEGHISRCDDEHANLVLKVLERMLERNPQGAGSPRRENEKQHRFIARLMDYLGWTWAQTADFCRHQTEKSSTRKCNAKELSKLILGMIALVDRDISAGRIKLSKAEYETYCRYTKTHRPSFLNQGGSHDTV